MLHHRSARPPAQSMAEAIPHLLHWQRLGKKIARAHSGEVADQRKALMNQRLGGERKEDLVPNVVADSHGHDHQAVVIAMLMEISHIVACPALASQ